MPVFTYFYYKKGLHSVWEGDWKCWKSGKDKKMTRGDVGGWIVGKAGSNTELYELSSPIGELSCFGKVLLLQNIFLQSFRWCRLKSASYTGRYLYGDLLLNCKIKIHYIVMEVLPLDCLTAVFSTMMSHIAVLIIWHSVRWLLCNVPGSSMTSQVVLVPKPNKQWVYMRSSVPVTVNT